MDVSFSTEFEYFSYLFFQFFCGWLVVRIICWFYGQVVYFISRSMGD